MIEMVLLSVLMALFVFRIIKNKKVHDIAVFLVLLICILIRLPIGQDIPKSLYVTISLGLAIIAVLSYLKSKNDAFKEATKLKDNPKEESSDNELRS
ncbi:hypothetical protein [Clostridium cylindrosporum]|uniref:Uncharacterized protein n=1 Tax=Clostridium cylindrosporum DSM 605 TaxID=1121307 RepID=A0A0J8FZW5_CLOCY|nr:hypothetical protein [Clostridium cylindrosporum]KMT21096.1 hypothetical protein CLCY_1c03300 [Clostridium cylindrosporum DSM 605]